MGVRAGSGGRGGDGRRRAHGGGADRARQAAAPDAGRQRGAAGPRAQVPRVRRLRGAHRPRRGRALPLARQRHRRHPDLYRSILKDAGTSADNKFSSIALTNFIAGAAAGCTTLVLIYPLDIAHTRLAADIGRTDTRQFRGICHFVQTIYNKNGIRGIYRGLPASLQGMVVHRGLYFGGFDTAKDVMVPLDSPLWQRWVTAQAVTSMAGLISYPLDTVRRRMMMQSGMDVQMYSSTLDCWRKIYKVEGIKSFYRGALSNMFRSTGAAAILVLYDEVKKFMDRGRL